MRNYVINFLATNSATLESFVTTAQIQLLSRITKTGWLDVDDAHREVVAKP
jgi:exportin-7